jgi:thiol-disulfide isomerase/thioredoxin
MATDDNLLSRARRLGRRLQPEPVRAEARGAADDADQLWPVDADFSLGGATDWLNSPPLTGPDLRGRVVLVNFWTYTCINWLRQLPHLRSWEEAYADSGLVVVGVHSPEFSFEHDLANVRREIGTRGIGYPVAVDNRFAVWRSFHNHFWPALYLVGADGRLRHHAFGEGGYEETDHVLRELLTEAGAGNLPVPQVRVDPGSVEAPADWDTLRSPETYLGYDRTSGFASPGGMVVERAREYSAPAHLRLGHWSLSGAWSAGRESAASLEAGARLAYRFESRDVHLVMAPAEPGSAVPFRVVLDGGRPGADRGSDVDADGAGTLTEPRLHQLVRRRGAVVESTVEIEFLDAGAAVYAFTFG